MRVDRNCIGAVIHQQAPAGAMAQCRDPQGAGSGKQIQHGGTFQRKADVEILVAQHIENRLAGAVGSGPHTGIVRCDKPPSAINAAGNAHKSSWNDG